MEFEIKVIKQSSVHSDTFRYIMNSLVCIVIYKELEWKTHVLLFCQKYSENGLQKYSQGNIKKGHLRKNK